MNIYLDIDGVLLANSNNAAAYADEFLTLILKRCPDSTYWLTTHFWRGQDTTRKVLEPVLKPKTIELLEQIKPAYWEELKTEGIDFKRPFLWFDDDLISEERQILEHYGALECFRLVDLVADPLQLLDEIDYLRSLG